MITISEEEKTKIISGKSDYTFDSMADELKLEILGVLKKSGRNDDPTPAINNTLLIVMLLSEEKTVAEVAGIMNMPEEAIELVQDLFGDIVNLARYIHMGLIMRTMEEYGINAIAALPLTNKIIKEFIFRRIRENPSASS